MARLSSERLTVQSPLARYAEEVGWTYLPREEALRLRRGETGPILWDVFAQQAQRLNPGRVDALEAEEVARRLVRVPASIEGNLLAWEYLRGLKTVFVPAQGRERNLRLVDFDDPDGNAFHVTQEFEFTNGAHTIRADVVFLLNGVPSSSSRPRRPPGSTPPCPSTTVWPSTSCGSTGRPWTGSSWTWRRRRG